VYVLVTLHRDLNAVEYYVVPSWFVARNVKVERSAKGTWYSILKSPQLERFRNGWDYFGEHGDQTT
jgi:hypothetical protein